jgi:peptidoglycan hydrolase-like protein with peptidoglycan-binding domain
MDEYGIPIDHVIRHYDVTGKICPNPYVRNNGKNGNWTWEQFKANLAQYRKSGTITLYSGADPEPAPVAEKVKVTSKLRKLSKGDRGDDVKIWQLIAGVSPDGIFGEKTLDATVNFQTAHGLDGDGIVGQKTWVKGLNCL